MYMYMHVHPRTYIYTYEVSHARMCIRITTCNAQICVVRFICVKYMYVMLVCMYVSIFMHINVYILICTHLHIYKYVYICTYPHVQYTQYTPNHSDSQYNIHTTHLVLHHQQLSATDLTQVLHNV
jgi:hypothetical protein